MRGRRWRRRRYRYKRIKINHKKWKRLAILFSILWCVFQILAFMYRNVYNVVMDYATTQTVNIATMAIHEGIARSNLDAYNVEDFVLFSENGNSHTINTPLINRLRVNITQEIEGILLQIETGNLSQLGLSNVQETPLRNGVLLEVPWAAAFNLTLFHEIGPRTPVRATVIGNTRSDIEVERTPFGINNVLLEMMLHVELNLHVAMPFRSEETTVEVSIPLVTTTIQGDIPDVFLGSGLR